MHCSLIRVSAIAAVFLTASLTQAQNRSSADSSGSSLFGSGQSAFGGSGFGGGGLGSGGFGGQSGFGQGGLGQGGFGQSGFGQGGFGQQGAGQQGGGFIGRDGGEIGAIFEGMQQGANQFMNRFERAMGSRNRGRGQNQSSEAAPKIRVKLKLGFTPPPVTPAMTAVSLSRVNTILTSKNLGTASLSGSTVVLTGTVQSASDKLVAEKLAMFEPGVRRVENRLTVAEEVEPGSGPEVIEPLGR